MLGLGCALLAATLPTGVAGAERLAAPRSLAAGTEVLLGVRAAHPLTALVGVPEVATRATAAPPLQLALTHSNAFMGGSARGQSLLLDGETTRLALRYRRVLGECWSVGIAAAVLAHDGGHFDAGIERWHAAFGLPNADREFAPRDALRFDWRVAGAVTPLPLESAVAGLGDTQLFVQRPLACTRQRDAGAIVRVGAKLPTGRLDDWTGSGGTDLWTDVQTPVYDNGAGWRVAASAGVLLQGDVARLPGQRRWVGFGALGTRVRVGPRLALHAALDWHTAPFESELQELDAFALSLSTGFSFAPGRASRVDVVLVEDVLVDTASDVALRLALTIAPRAD